MLKCIVITTKFIRYRLCTYSFLLCRSTREIVNDKFYVNICRHIFSLICFLFQEPAYCKLIYFEILKICDFVNSFKKKNKKKTKKKTKNKKKNRKKKKKRRGKKRNGCRGGGAHKKKMNVSLWYCISEVNRAFTKS